MCKKISCHCRFPTWQQYNIECECPPPLLHSLYRVINIHPCICTCNISRKLSIQSNVWALLFPMHALIMHSWCVIIVVIIRCYLKYHMGTKFRGVKILRFRWNIFIIKFSRVLLLQICIRSYGCKYHAPFQISCAMVLMDQWTSDGEGNNTVSLRWSVGEWK